MAHGSEAKEKQDNDQELDRSSRLIEPTYWHRKNKMMRLERGRPNRRNVRWSESRKTMKAKYEDPLRLTFPNIALGDSIIPFLANKVKLDECAHAI